jgi:Serine carboxypeptidase
MSTIKILIYAGDKDIICNYIGLRDSLESRFGKRSKMEWKYGEYQEWDNLSLFVIRNASHMVPFDHPMGAKEVSRNLLGLGEAMGDGAKTVRAPSHFIAGLLLLVFFALAVFGGLFLRKKIATTDAVQKW